MKTRRFSGPGCLGGLSQSQCLTAQPLKGTGLELAGTVQLEACHGVRSSACGSQETEERGFGEEEAPSVSSCSDQAPPPTAVQGGCGAATTQRPGSGAHSWGTSTSRPSVLPFQGIWGSPSWGPFPSLSHPSPTSVHPWEEPGLAGVSGLPQGATPPVHNKPIHVFSMASLVTVQEGRKAAALPLP